MHSHYLLHGYIYIASFQANKIKSAKQKLCYLDAALTTLNTIVCAAKSTPVNSIHTFAVITGHACAARR